MPQASDEQRVTMKKWFGDDVSDFGPIKFLQSHGFVLRKDWLWELPVPHHRVSCYENECITFLIHEWDFGGIYRDNLTWVCLCGQSKIKSGQAFQAT